MNNLTPKKRIFGLPPLLILIFFFMPWVTLSCSGQSSSASGYQLAIEGGYTPGDARIAILAIGIAAVVALGVAVATNPLSRRFYTGAGLVAGASYLYLLLRFGAFAEEARRQGGTLTLELAVWGVGLAIMSIIGLGALYRPDESDSVSSDPDDAMAAYRRAQQAQQEKMVQYAIFAVLAVVGGVFLLSLFQSIGADLERRQVISNATATREAQDQAILNQQGTRQAENAIAAQTAAANASATAQVVSSYATATAEQINLVLSTAQAVEQTQIQAITRAWEGVNSNTEWQELYPGGVVQEFEGVQFVLVPAGCFTMGTMYFVGLDDTLPQMHQQCVDEPFWLAKTETSIRDFLRLGGTLPALYNDVSNDNYPIRDIEWRSARDFCAINGWRLPTEREWEFAASGPDSLIYPWGLLYDENRTVRVPDSASDASRVGSRPLGASWVGALDLIGNVHEWTSSLYMSYPYSLSDGRESLNSSTGGRVYRPGRFDNAAFGRDHDIFSGDNASANYVGFRCARSVSYRPDFDARYTEKEIPDLSGLVFDGSLDHITDAGREQISVKITILEMSQTRVRGTVERRCIECLYDWDNIGELAFVLAQVEGTIEGNTLFLREIAKERERSINSSGNWELTSWLLYVSETNSGFELSGLELRSPAAVSLAQSGNYAPTEIPVAGPEIFRDSFDDNHNNWESVVAESVLARRSWEEAEVSDVSSQIVNGKFLMYFNRGSELGWLVMPTAPTMREPYEVEVNFRVLDHGYGSELLVGYNMQSNYLGGAIINFSVYDGTWSSWSWPNWPIPGSGDDYKGVVNLSVADGEYHVLKLRVFNDQATLYIDNTEIGSRSHVRISGGVAIGIARSKYYNTQIEFDDFVIRAVAPAASSIPAPTRTSAPTRTPSVIRTAIPAHTATPTHTPAPPTATLADADVIATSVAATVAALQAPTQNATPVVDYTLTCSQSVSSLGLANGASAVVTCAQNCAQSGGTVWGTDIYTHDSSICRAALHSGIPSNQPFRVEVLPGQSSYRGSTRNSIQTSNYGSWSLSFRVTVIE